MMNQSLGIRIDNATHFRADVCVCGAGPAGFIAAIASARTGAKTILIERYGFPGGMATAGMVGPISKFNLNSKRIVGGIPLEFINRMSNMNGAICNLPSGNIPFDSETYKNTAINMLLESGVDILFHSEIIGSEFCEIGRASKVLACSRGNIFAVSAEYIIDATGTGDFIAQSPLSWKMRSEDETRQPMSLIFRMGGVDTDAIRVLMDKDNEKYANPSLRGILTEAVDFGHIANFGGPWAVWGSVIGDGQVSVNATRINCNSTDVREITIAEIRARNEIFKMVELFKMKHSAFNKSYLISTATLAGYREAREVTCVYRITGDDVLDGVQHEDNVCLGGHPVDSHQPNSNKQDVRFINKPYGIPFRSMIPINSTNVLVAGAIISADKTAFATIRTQAQCMAMGQAAGTAVALCKQNKSDVLNLNINILRKKLEHDGAIL